MGQRERDEVWDRRADRAADSLTYHPWWTALKWGLGLLAVLLVLSVVGNAFGILSVWWGGEQAQITNPSRVKQQVFDPNNTIAQISFFHNQCEGVNADAQIVSQNAATYLADKRVLAGATDPISQQQARDALLQDQQNITGPRNALVQRAADYNSRSQQSTANVFKGHGLPRRIDVPSTIEALATFHVNCGSGR